MGGGGRVALHEPFVTRHRASIRCGHASDRHSDRDAGRSLRVVKRRLDGASGEHHAERLLRPFVDETLVSEALSNLVAHPQVQHRPVERRREGGDDSFFPNRHGRKAVRVTRVQRPVHGLERCEVGEVALVVLKHDRDARRVDAESEEVAIHFSEAFERFLPAVGGGVGDEDDSVGALEEHAPTRGVNGLSRHRDHLQPEVVALERQRLDGQEVEQDGSLLRRVHRHELSPAPGVGESVQHQQVGRLAARCGPVVHDPGSDDPFVAIDVDHHPEFRPDEEIL